MILPTAGTDILLDAVRQVLEDPSFNTGTPEATEARDAALSLHKWQEKADCSFRTFSRDISSELEGLFDGSERRTQSASRERLWQKYFALRSSDRFISRWISFLSAAEISTTPILYQHLTDLMFRAIMRYKYCIPSSNESEVDAVTCNEANALRYAAGYVCRHLKHKLQRSSHPLKNEMVQCLQQLVRARSESDECGVAEEWTELVDRGGLCRISDPAFQVFYSLEVEVRSSLESLLNKATHSHKDTLIQQLVSSEDIQFHWCIAAAEFDVQDEECQSTLLKSIIELYITIRGFAHASAWMEKYKQSQRKSTQRAKSLRKTLYTEKNQ